MFVATVLSSAVVVLASLVAPSVVSAIDYPGGWLPTPPKQQCVDICVHSKAAPTCLTGDPQCLAKQQRPGDYDYLLLEQLFVPQFCRDLLRGVDSTISHQNVHAFPTGIACEPRVVQSELTIHGLWPNYNDGYAGCCNVTETLANKPFDAAAFARDHKQLLKKMATMWIDATQRSARDTLCEIYNHEFQKHGICYHAFGDDYDRAAVNYFEATLTVAGKLDKATNKINQWAKGPAQRTTVAAVQQLYATNVQVLCANVEGTNELSAIRTCWVKPAVSNAKGPFTAKDCAAPTKGGAFKPCDATTPITLDAYVAPRTSSSSIESSMPPPPPRHGGPHGK